jgi:hypothetical protein
MKPSSAAFVVMVRTFLICAWYAFSITTHAQSTLSRSPFAQSDSDQEARSEELQGSAAVHATFSRDGSHVYAIDLETPHLFDIDLQKNVVSILNLGASIDNKSIISVGTSKSDDLLVVTTRAAWSCKPGSKACNKLCGAPEGSQFAAIAYDPKSSGILFSTRTSFDWPAQSNASADPAMFLAAGAKEPKPVWLRRVGFLDGIAFASDGQQHFRFSLTRRIKRAFSLCRQPRARCGYLPCEGSNMYPWVTSIRLNSEPPMPATGGTLLAGC